MRRKLGIAVASIALIGAAGCGGSNRNAGYGSNRGAGYGAFIAQLNSICSQGTSAVNAANGDQAKLAAADKFEAKLAALNAPDQLKSIFNQLISKSREAFAAQKTGDVAKATALQPQVQALASQLGAAECLKS